MDCDSMQIMSSVGLSLVVVLLAFIVFAICCCAGQAITDHIANKVLNGKIKYKKVTSEKWVREDSK